MRISFYKSNSLIVGGGAENLLIEVSKRLAENHDVKIITLDQLPDVRLKPEAVQALLEDVECSELTSFRFPRGVALPKLSGIKLLLEVIRTSDITYVVLPASPVDMLFCVFGMITRKGIIAGIHGFLRKDVLLQRMYSPIFKKLLRKFRALHVTNRETYTWLKKEGFNNVYFIPNGVDSDRFRLSRTSLKSELFNVLFTGRLSEEKGAALLVDIIHYVNTKSNSLNLVFTIAGSGELAPRIEELENIYDNVRYLGFVNPDILPDVYNSAQLYLIPSRMEGMPLRLLEAQSCGLPCLGSNIFGISDIIIQGKTGFLVDLHNIKGFADTIVEYYKLWSSSPDEYDLLSQRIRKSTLTKYDWKQTVSNLERMFEDSLA